MRLLALTARLPFPPDRGDRLRAFHILQRLGREHEVHLVSFIADPAEKAHLSALRAFCADVQLVYQPPWRSALTVAAHLWRAEPLQTLYYRSPGMQRRVTAMRRATRFDAAYIHLFRMAPYLAAAPDLYRIVDLTDVISGEVARSLAYRGRLSRWLYQVELPRIRRTEQAIAQQFEEVWLVAGEDRRDLAARCPTANVQVITNGVDLARLQPLGIAPTPYSLIMVGHWRVLHNIDAALYLMSDIWPNLRQRYPECRLTLVGADPAPEIQALASHPGVQVTGFVPDLNLYLNQAAVFVAPLRFSAGVQNKVLEAMAAGRPVVTTERVRAGLGARAGGQLLVGDSAETLTQHIVDLWEQPALAAQLGHAARQFVAQHFTWEQAAARLQAIQAGLQP